MRNEHWTTRSRKTSGNRSETADSLVASVVALDDQIRRACSGCVTRTPVFAEPVYSLKSM